MCGFQWVEPPMSGVSDTRLCILRIKQPLYNFRVSHDGWGVINSFSVKVTE